MKHFFTLTFASFSAAFVSGQVIKPMAGYYPDGVFKKEQRIKTTYTNKVEEPKEVYSNIRSVGKAYILKPGFRQTTKVTQAAQKGLQHIEYTFTEISGIRSDDGMVTDYGNPIEDHLVYAYYSDYNKNGISGKFEGNPAYINAMIDGNMAVLSPGIQNTFFLHNDYERHIGESWSDTQFAYPLFNKMNLDYTFEKMETDEFGRNVCRLAVTGTVKVKGNTHVLKEVKEADLTGTVTGYMQVDPGNNQIHRFKVEVKMSGQIKMHDKMQPYDVTMKINEWSMNPSNINKKSDY